MSPWMNRVRQSQIMEYLLILCTYVCKVVVSNDLEDAGAPIFQIKNHLKEDDRHFAYLRLTVGDTESKRTKFVFISWVGNLVSVLQKAEMSVHKAFVKDKLGLQFAVEFHFEDISEIETEKIEKAVKLAGGADYSGQQN